MSNGGPEEYIGLDIAMRRLKLSRRQVYRYASENRIRILPTRQGQLYHRGDVEALAAALKVDQRPDKVQVDTPRPTQDRAALNREIEELRGLRVELLQLISEQRKQNLLTDSDRQTASDTQARLDKAIAELEATRQALVRPFYVRWEFWAFVVVVAALIFFAFFR
jgi:hypothetical protein